MYVCGEFVAVVVLEASVLPRKRRIGTQTGREGAFRLGGGGGGALIRLDWDWDELSTEAAATDSIRL